MLFTPEGRDEVEARLARRAADDPALTAAALLGSLASGDADRWSDIDLALRLAARADESAVVRAWTDTMYTDHAAVHHVDLWMRRTRYRAFLLESTLQVDLSFWPSADFPFADTGGPSAPAAPDVDQLVGMGWLYAVHVRSALARGRPWQAVHMIDGARDQAIGLMCLRHGLPAHEGRGVDRLPAAVRDRLAPTRAPTVDAGDLAFSFAAVVDLLIAEMVVAQPDVAARLAPALRRLAT